MGISYGIKLVAAASFICAAVLIAGCSWTFYHASLDLNERLKNSGVEQSKSKFHKNLIRTSETDETEAYDNVLHEMEILWTHNQPMFLLLSAIGIVTGTFQLLTCFVSIICTDKKIRKWTRHWLIIHIIIFLVLILVLLSTMVGKIHDGDRKMTWTQLLNIFNSHLKERQPDQDFTTLILQLKNGFTILYGAVGQDATGVLLLFCLTVYLLRGQEVDYETQA